MPMLIAMLLAVASASDDKPAAPNPDDMVSAHARAMRARGIIQTADLPAGYVITDGESPMFLRLSEAPLRMLRPASEAEANFSIHFIERKSESTMLTTAWSGAGRLKVDMFFSPDGERWEYTSSCPPPTYETWGHPVPFLAVANPRFLAEDDLGICE